MGDSYFREVWEEGGGSAIFDPSEVNWRQHVHSIRELVCSFKPSVKEQKAIDERKKGRR
jgi:hypothetical protein